MEIQPVANNVTTNNSKKQATPIRVKLASACGATLGVATAVAWVSKRQGFSLSPSVIKNTKIKDWAIFGITDKLKPDKKVLKLEWAEIMSIGVGSVLGGLVGGSLFDKKEHFSSKCSEAVSQLLGDIAIPLSIVAIPTMMYKKFEDFADKSTKYVKLQNVSKFIKSNKFLKILCPTLVSGTSLAVGIITGNKVSNKLNEKLHGVKQERGIRATDFAPHLDDVCLAITLMAEKNPLGDIISKFVPIALSIAGIETGTANPDNRVG